jgi:hypothetical protein
MLRGFGKALIGRGLCAPHEACGSRPAPVQQRSEDTRILLEPAAALGDLGAQMDLAHCLMRERYGVRHILTGILLAFDAARKAVAIVAPEYEPASM